MHILVKYKRGTTRAKGRLKLIHTSPKSLSSLSNPVV
jgi:hypothetical protein